MTTNLVPSGALVEFRPHPMGEGEQFVARFRNGYGASIVRHFGSYGGPDGLWELAVITFGSESPWDFALVYDTPITDDVLGWLTEQQVYETCEQIADLPPRGE